MNYQDLYIKESEPWNYSRRAAEIVRHETIEAVVREIAKPISRGLDVGASLGQLSRRLKKFMTNLYACDVSLDAVAKARTLKENSGIRFLQAGLPGLPFQARQFDLIVVADGLHEFVPENARDLAVGEIHSALNWDGTAIFSDYMRPGKFEPFIQMIEKRFAITKLIYLNDRPWYQFESWFKAVRHWGIVQWILSQVWIARALQVPARFLGTRGSTHLIIVAQKNG